MPEVPECLNRRYRALDDLIEDLDSAVPRSPPAARLCSTSFGSHDAGVRMMCDFWNILRDEPDCDLSHAVAQRMGIRESGSGFARPQQEVTCYMAGCNRGKDDKGKKKPGSSSGTDSDNQCCSSKSVTPSITSDPLPLNKVLCNLKQAASYDKKCNAKVYKLMEAQKTLQEQIQHLEHREKEGVQMLKQADCLWTCMEDEYKKKLAESQERQKELNKRLKEVDASHAKWRNNKKDLEFQLTNVTKCHEEILEKINQKTNDMKCMEKDIASFKKRMETVNKDTEMSKKSLANKRLASDKNVSRINSEITKLEGQLKQARIFKARKEKEGSGFIKDARNDLANICKLLMHRKLTKEDLLAEKNALTDEINLLKQTCETCKEKCAKKRQDLAEEIAKIDEKIGDFTVQCVKCHQCTDTGDTRKFCSDCPRCEADRECILDEDHCELDKAEDCVCMSVKHKLLDNVFENMYTVLERQVSSCPGRAVAQSVLNCLKKSQNGKLDAQTRAILQEFILTTIKRNLNLTIVGGAVKTRCEMEPETYEQLMLCLKQVKPSRPPNADKAIPVKKDPCPRWGGTSECHCPKGPKDCICKHKAPRPPKDPAPCPVDEEDALKPVTCPHKLGDKPCGPDCGAQAAPDRVAAEVASWRPDPCKDSTNCPFSSNMRAAQCMLGPESLTSLVQCKGIASSVPVLPNISTMHDQINCKCGKTPTKQCTCRRDCRAHPRNRMIMEVMGRYTDVSPIEKDQNK